MPNFYTNLLQEQNIRIWKTSGIRSPNNVHKSSSAGKPDAGN